MKRILEMKNLLRTAGVFLVIIVFATSAFVWAFSPRKDLKPSEFGIGKTYDVAMKEKKPIVTLFYADWCTYCIKFMPKYKILSDAYRDKYNFVMINADDPSAENIVRDYAIGGFPTIYIVDPTIDNRILISNTLYDELRKVRVELERYLRIRDMIKL